MSSRDSPPDLARSLASFAIVAAQRVDADRRADAGRQQVDARLDGMVQTVADAGGTASALCWRGRARQSDCRVQARPPSALGLRLITVSNIFQRSGIGPRVAAAAGLCPVCVRSAAPSLALQLMGNDYDDLVLGLQQLVRLGDRRPGRVTGI